MKQKEASTQNEQSAEVRYTEDGYAIPEHNMLAAMGEFTALTKYAQHIKDKKRRETWVENVDRVLEMHLNHYAWLPKKYLKQIRHAFNYVKGKVVVPAMRTMQFGGPGVEAHQARAFNCSVRHIDSLRAFAEIFYVLLAGCGNTFSVRKKWMKRLPYLVTAQDKTGTTITYIVEDTIEGWADSLEALLQCYFKNTALTGRKIVFDYSKIRPEGAPLKTSGGKAPGYKGLKQCHQRIKKLLDHIIEVKQQNRLLPINAYDIVMHASDAVLSGGIRRAATMCIFDPDDTDMMKAKTFFKVTYLSELSLNKKGTHYSGEVEVDDIIYKVEFLKDDATDEYAMKELKSKKVIAWNYVFPWRARSNNSILLMRDQVTLEEFRTIFQNTKLYGEPGFIFADHEDYMLNPCSEVGFIPVTEDGRCGIQFCNLTSINGAKVTSLEEFLEACKAAAIIGTIQAGYTHYPYLSSAAKELTEDEALLGVSITGIMDNPELLLDPVTQIHGAEEVKRVNKEWAEIIHINQAARTTLIKPEGTSSIVLESASGIHPHHAKPRYFRRIQMNKKDNVYKLFKKMNPHMCEESVWSSTKSDDVITWPIQVDSNVISKADLSAIKHLEIVKNTYQNWVVTGSSSTNKKNITHNVSCTIIVKESEWEDVIKYMYQNRHSFAAVSFIPDKGERLYKQAPNQSVLKEDQEYWNNLVLKYTPVDYSQLVEEEDQTQFQGVVACAGGACESDFPTLK